MIKSVVENRKKHYGKVFKTVLNISNTYKTVSLRFKKLFDKA